MSKVSERIRREFQAADDIRDAGLTVPEDVALYLDISYGADDACQLLDVYKPKQAQESLLPVIVSVHGGGWVYGDKQRYRYYCMSLAQRGFAVVNYTYRLAPEHQFPAPLEDANLVFDWVQQHAQEYGMDGAHVFAVGDSAGAQILGLYLGLCTDRTYAAAFPFQPCGLMPKAVAFSCGAYRAAVQLPQIRALMEDLLPNRGTPEELEQLSVLNRVNDRFPPVFLMTGTGDFLQEDALLLSEALMKHSVPFVFRFYGDADTLLGHVFHCDMRSEDARQCNDDECGFFQAHCRA